ncbi:hypothetical protein [Streptomyces sp. NPDC087300]|uniref:hypothetical protein n=1 Tax=Streptomyces sp. NPDC087300 TaxID=3365780 RepID=UPI003814040C
MTSTTGVGSGAEPDVGFGADPDVASDVVDGLGSEDGGGTVTLSKAAATKSSTVEGDGSELGAGTLALGVGEGSEEGAGTVGLAGSGEEEADEGGDEGVDEEDVDAGASVSRAVARPGSRASGTLSLRDRPNAFRRRFRMPMCATLRVS